MENWIAYALVATVCFGINTVIYKIATQKSNLSPYYGTLMFGVGVFLTIALFFLLKPSFEFEWKSSGLAILSGIIWAVGFIAIAIAISQKADVSRISPIFNSNTLIAVFLGIFLLHEIPNGSQTLRIIGGSILIISGAVLVSL